MQGGHFIAEESESQSSLHILSLEIPTVSVTEKLLLFQLVPETQFKGHLKVFKKVSLLQVQVVPYTDCREGSEAQRVNDSILTKKKFNEKICKYGEKASNNIQWQRNL